MLTSDALVRTCLGRAAQAGMDLSNLRAVNVAEFLTFCRRPDLFLSNLSDLRVGSRRYNLSDLRVGCKVQSDFSFSSGIIKGYLKGLIYEKTSCPFFQSAKPKLKV